MIKNFDQRKHQNGPDLDVENDQNDMHDAFDQSAQVLQLELFSDISPEDAESDFQNDLTYYRGLIAHLTNILGKRTSKVIDKGFLLKQLSDL